MANKTTMPEPVAVIRFERNKPGNENEMPKVISCNRLPDGDYQVFLAPQPDDINIDYKQMFDQMCERCDALDAKLAEYSEQPTPAAREPSDNEMAAIWDQIHASFGREPFRVSHVDYSRALLARYGHLVEPEGWRLVPVELTLDMMFLGVAEWLTRDDPEEDVQGIWEAMLEAAPKFGE